MTDSELIQITTDALAASAKIAGPHLTCHPGCHQCCVGVFPVSQLDASRLRIGLESSPKKHAIWERAAVSRERLKQGFPGDLISGIIDTEDPAFEDFANEEPCPVLDPASGTCDLYESRPIPCRTFGPPMRTEEDGLAVCELCFTKATPEETAAAEVDSTFLAIEAELNSAHEDVHGLHGYTLIAFALSGA